MKKVIFAVALIFTICQVQAQSIMFSIWSVEKDTAVQGMTLTIRINGASLGHPTDTGRVYIHGPSSYTEIFKINLNDLNTLPADNGARLITVSLPEEYKGDGIYFFSNGNVATQFPCFIRSATPDLRWDPTPEVNGPLDGYPGYQINLKVKWTYSAVQGDTVRFFIDGIEAYKESLASMETDSVASFHVMGTPGSHILTCNYGVFDYEITLNTPTNIVQPYFAEQKKAVAYFDILGRPTIPVEGDLIRYTPAGAIVYQSSR